MNETNLITFSSFKYTRCVGIVVLQTSLTVPLTWFSCFYRRLFQIWEMFLVSSWQYWLCSLTHQVHIDLWAVSFWSFNLPSWSTYCCVQFVVPFSWRQSPFDGWVTAELSARWTHQWVVNRKVSLSFKGHRIATDIWLMKQFAHIWYLHRRQCSKTNMF